MIDNETDLRHNVRELRNCGSNFDDACEKAFKEVSDFLKGGSTLAKDLSSQNMLKMDGNSIVIDNTLYKDK